MAYETYRAVANKAQARDLAATESPFTIEVRFLGGLNTRQKAAFTAAADRWVKAIVGDLPPVRIGDDVIDDVLIEAQGGRSTVPEDPRPSRPDSHPPGGHRCVSIVARQGIMTFDTDDLKKMQSEGTLNDVITHEMGHVLGIGTIWPLKKLLKGEGTENPTFSGKAAMAAYKKLREPAAPCGCRSRTRRSRHGRRPLARDRLPQRADVRLHRGAGQPDERGDRRQSPGPRLHRRPGRPSRSPCLICCRSPRTGAWSRRADRSPTGWS